MVDRSTWQSFFDRHAASYNENSFTQATVAEVDFVIEALSLAPSARILDMGCGTGRHAVEMARRGYRVTGVDLSAGMLAEARKAADAAGVNVEWIQADATLYRPQAVFDAAICLCEGAFGLLGANEDPVTHGQSILRNIAAGLTPDGGFLLTALNALRGLRDVTQADIDTGRFDPATLVWDQEGEVMLDGHLERVRMRERRYVPSELVLLLRQAGFDVLHVWRGARGRGSALLCVSTIWKSCLSRGSVGDVREAGDETFLSRRLAWLLAAIVVVAAILRLAGLNHFPPGLSVDEAYNLIDARRILAGDRPLFLPDNAGREALYSYWQAAVVGLLGATPFALRLASALIGIVTVPVSYWCLRALPWRYARLTALVAAALLAVLFWHVVFSRFGIRAISLPLVVALLFGCLWRAQARDRLSLYALGGAALGVALYTGTAARLLPLAPIAMTLWLAWVDRPRARRYLRGLAVVLGMAALVAVPLAVYFAQHPNQFTTHLSEVAIGPGETLVNVARVLAMFNVQGDLAWWRNLAGRPAFDPLVGVLFLAGLALVVGEALSTTDHRPPTTEATTDDGPPQTTDVGAGSPRPGPQEGRDTLPLQWPVVDEAVVSGQGSGVGPATAAVFTLTWLITMLLPTIAADNAPNFSRAIGILPVALVFPARALVLGWAWLRPRTPRLATPLLVGALLVSLAWTTWDYFVVFGSRPEPYYAYDAEKAAAGRWLRAEAETRAVFAAPDVASHATLRAVTDGVDVRRFDTTRGLVVPDGPATYAVWAREDAPPPFGLDRLGAQRQTVADDLGRPLLTVYRLDRAEPGALRDALGLRPGQARFGDSIGLSGVSLTPGDAAHGPQATLMWTTLAPLDRDLTVFVHFVDATGQTVAQADGEPLGATYRTSQWRAGDRIIEERAAAPLPPGTYRVRVGWYDRATGERLPLPGSADNAFDAGTVEVRP